jgi:prepilin-type N-terminal cleavage/methylation domain-containing protein
MRRSTRAFTLIELLVVVAIVAIIAGMLLPAVSMTRDAARGAVCGGRLRQVAMAVLAYADDWNGLLPPSYRPAWGTNVPAAAEQWNWRGAVEAGGYLGNERSGGTGNHLPVMGCPVQQREHAIDPANLVFNPLNTSGWATYAANGHLTAAPLPDAGTALSAIGHGTEAMLIADGRWTLSSWNPAVWGSSVGGLPAGPHRARLQTTFLDGHQASLARSVMVDAVPAWNAAGSASRSFWLGGL